MRLQENGYVPDPGQYPSFRPWVTEMPPKLVTVNGESLFTVEKNAGASCFVHTWFKDRDYCVPDDAISTKHIFGLLSQLIATQTAASDLSITPIVRVIE